MLNDADTTAAVDHRTNLDRTRADLTAKLAGLRHDLRAVEDGDADMSSGEEGGEGSGVSVDRDRLVSLMAAIAAQLDDTEVSLARLRAGTYGICECCHQPIPPARLEAVPNARLCVSCKAGGINSRR
jgi:DnaK suppressor protein